MKPGLRRFGNIPLGSQFADIGDGSFTMKTSCFVVGGEKFNAVTVNVGSINDYDPEDINNYATWIDPDTIVSVQKPMTGLNEPLIQANLFVRHFQEEVERCQKEGKDGTRWRENLKHAEWWKRLVETPLEVSELDAYGAEVLQLVSSIVVSRPAKGAGARALEKVVWRWYRNQSL